MDFFSINFDFLKMLHEKIFFLIIEVWGAPFNLQPGWMPHSPLPGPALRADEEERESDN